MQEAPAWSPCPKPTPHQGPGSDHGALLPGQDPAQARLALSFKRETGESVTSGDTEPLPTGLR